MAESLDVNVSCVVSSCSWKHLECDEIQKTVATVVSDAVARLRSIEVDDLVSADSSRIFLKEDCSEPFQFTITSEWRIWKVYIVSDAQLLEIFRKSGEYLKTCQASFQYECEGMVVYTAEINLDSCTDCLSVKFTKVHEPDRVTIYGIRVECEASPISKISLDHTANLPPQFKAFSERLQELSFSRLDDNPYMHWSSGDATCGRNCKKKVAEMEEKIHARINGVENKLLGEVRKNHLEVMATLGTILEAINIKK